MNRQSKSKQNGRRNSRPHIQLLKFVLDSDEFGQLSGNAVKLLLELHRQYNGYNNGDLCATWSRMKVRGWKSKGTLARSLRELTDAGFVVLSRISYQKRTPNLYALTYLSVDECGGKLDIDETHAPEHLWRTEKKFVTPYEGQITPYEGQRNEN